MPKQYENEPQPGKTYAFDVAQYMAGKPMQEVPKNHVMFVRPDGSQIRVRMKSDGAIDITKVYGTGGDDLLTITPGSINTITIK